jgi:hypothetical protein
VELQNLGSIIGREPKQTLRSVEAVLGEQFQVSPDQLLQSFAVPED